MTMRTRDHIENFIDGNFRRKRWKRVFSVMMAIVVFVTTYVLILPAITAEGNTYCNVTAADHVHTLACYSNPEADAESAIDWEATLPEGLPGKTGGQDAEGILVDADALVAVAKSQIGYQESKDNYAVAEDGKTIKGYSRYGAWKGDQYEPWALSFAAFCLSYAGADQAALWDLLPADVADQDAWILALQKAGYEKVFASDGHGSRAGSDSSDNNTSDTYAFVPGDLVFLQTEKEGSVTLPHAGFVLSTSSNQITLIEGDRDNRVCKNSYRKNSDQIVAVFSLCKNTDDQTAGTTPAKGQASGLADGENGSQASSASNPADQGNMSDTQLSPAGVENSFGGSGAIGANGSGEAYGSGLPGVNAGAETAGSTAGAKALQNGQSGDGSANAAGTDPAGAEAATGSGRNDLAGTGSAATDTDTAGALADKPYSISYQGRGYTVTASYGKEAGLPEGVSLNVKEIKLDRRYYKQAQAALEEAGSSLTGARFFDITFSEGRKEIEPQADLAITFSWNQAEAISDDTKVKAIHLPQGKEAEILDTAIASAPADQDQNGPAEGQAVETVTFLADSFSVYGIVYTVDFHYSDGDRTFDYSLPGGEKIKLSDLVEVLGIAEGTRYTSTDAFLEDVESVSFSNPDLVKITKGGLFGLGNDWILESLCPFDTQETLRIEMTNGDVIEVRVTDAQGTALNELVSDATLEINGQTYGEGQTWNVLPNVDYRLTLTFTEIGSRQFGTGGTTAVMDMPSGITLPEGQEGYFDIPAGLAGTITGNKYEVKDGKLYITFGDDADDILTRASDAHFDLTINAKFAEGTTNANFNDRVKRDVDTSTPADVSMNKSGSYNQATGKMDYVITISSYGNTKNISVSDAISGSILTLNGSSIKVEPEGTQLSAGPTVSGNGFNLQIKELNHNETVTIRYSADVNISDELKNNGYKLTESDKNSVTVTPEGGTEHKQDYVYPNEINYSNIAKTNTKTEDGNDSTVLEWKIVANNPATGSVAGGKITDKIGWNSKDAMTYQVGTDGKLPLTIVVTKDDGTTETRNISVDVKTDEWTGQQTWEYEIPEGDGKYSYEITYKTVVDKEKLDSNSNGIVTNEASVDHGGSTGGTGVVPGINPGGGEGGDDENPIIAGKTASTVTEEYIDWDIVVFIPAGKDYTNGFTITDQIPWHYGNADSGINGAMVDTIDTSYGNNGVEVIGLNGNETFDVKIDEVNQYLRDADGNSIYPQVATITFYQNQEKTDKGINKSDSARTLTVKVRTKNSAYWLWAATQNTEFSKHTNTANVNGVTVTGEGQPMLSSIKKTGAEADKPGWYTAGNDGDIYYRYDVQITNVSELPLTLTDTFDSDYMEFVDPSDVPEGTDLQTIYIQGGNMSYDNQTSSTNGSGITEGPYVPQFSVSGNTLTITVNDLFKKDDGTYYPYYHIRYYLKVKSDKLDELKAKAVQNKGSYKLGNTVVWGELSDKTDVDFSVPTLEKDGWFRDSVNSKGNNRLFDFMIDVNPDAIQLNGGDDLTLSDNHTNNLTVDYTTVKVYKITDSSVTSAQMKEAIQLLSKQNAGIALEEWEQDKLDAVAEKYEIDSSVDWDFTSNSGTFTGLTDSTHYVISYSALIVGSGSQSFSNEAEMNGFYSTKTGSRDFGSDAGAGASVYQIQLLKHEYGKTSKGLQGATFQLFVDDGNGNPVPMYYGNTAYTSGTYDSYPEEYKNFASFNSDHKNLVGEPVTFTTNESGYTLIALNQTVHGSQLEEGVHYYLKEIESPAGYKIDSSVEYWSFTLTKDPDEVNYGGRDAYGNRQWIYFYYDDILKMSNTTIEENEEITVKANKVWLNQNGSEMSDAEKAALTASVQLLRKTDDGEYQKVKVTRTGDNLNIETVTDDSGLVTLDSGNNWSYDWGKLPRKDAEGHTYAYKLEETALNGFASSVTSEEKSDDDGNVTLTLTATNQKVSTEYPTYGDLSVKKQWLKADGTEKDETKDARFTLYRVVSRTPFTTEPTAGGTPYDVTKNEKTNETFNRDKFGHDVENGVYKISKDDYSTGVTFKDLITAEKIGDVVYFYAYYIKETPIAGYDQELSTATDSDGNVIITMKNTEIPEPKTTSLKVDKKWQFEDADGNKTEIAPPSDGSYVQFRLFQVKSSTPFDDPTKITSGGTRYDAKDQWGQDLWFRKDVGTYEIGENWYWATREFPNLPAITVDSNGKATYYAYYVKEIGLDENVEDSYAITQNADGSYSIVMTNTMHPEPTEVEVSKTWTINGEAYSEGGKTWPEGVQVEVTLYRNGEVVQDGEEGSKVNRTLTLDADNTSGKFEDLPKEDADGNEYIYTVKEALKVLNSETGEYQITPTVDDKSVNSSIVATDTGYQITNDIQTPGSLKVTKTINKNGQTVDESKISFIVTGPNGFSQTFTYVQMDAGSPKSKTFDNLAPGNYTVKETDTNTGVSKTVSYVVSKEGSTETGSTVSGNYSASINVSGGTTTVAFTNEYAEYTGETTSFTLNKSWPGVADSDKQEVKFKLYQVAIPNAYSDGGNSDSDTDSTVTLPISLKIENNGNVEWRRINKAVTLNEEFNVTIQITYDGAAQWGFYMGYYKDPNSQWEGCGADDCLSTSNDKSKKIFAVKVLAIDDGKVTKVSINNTDYTLDKDGVLFATVESASKFTSGALSTDATTSELTPVYPQSGEKTQSDIEALGGTWLEDYGLITLNSTNDWTTTVSNLPKSDGGTTGYQYYVIEEGGAAYNAKYTHSGNSITVTNEKNTSTELVIKKKWVDSENNPVSAVDENKVVYFDIYQIASSGGGSTNLPDQVLDKAYAWPESGATSVSKSNGFFAYNNKYYYVWKDFTQAKEQIAAGPTNFTRNDGDGVVEFSGNVLNDSTVDYKNIHRGDLLLHDGKYYVFYKND